MSSAMDGLFGTSLGRGTSDHPIFLILSLMKELDGEECVS